MNDSEAGRFALEYAELRSRERWAESDRVRRKVAVARAIALVRDEVGADASIVDVGAGAQRNAGVITIDLGTDAQVRADMHNLPLRNASVDGALYAASLHYAPVEIAIAEAARVLRPGGLLIAIDSPVYDGAGAAAAAKGRSTAYYTAAGYPALAAHYHPIEVGALRLALARSGFDLLRLSTGSRWRRLLRRGPDSVVLARRLR